MLSFRFRWVLISILLITALAARFYFSKQFAEIYSASVSECRDKAMHFLSNEATNIGVGPVVEVAAMRLIRENDSLAYVALNIGNEQVDFSIFNHNVWTTLPPSLAPTLDSDQAKNELLKSTPSFLSKNLWIVPVKITLIREGQTESAGFLRLGCLAVGAKKAAGNVNMTDIASSGCLIFLLLNIFFGQKKRKLAFQRVEQEDKEVEDSEQFVDEGEAISNTITLSQKNPGLGDRWVSLLSPDANAQWEKKGTWYAMGDFVLASPWMAALTRRDLTFDRYAFRLKAKKLAGIDGFVVLFPVGDYQGVWVIGGWGNERSEFAGMNETRVPQTIQRDLWYDLTIEVGSVTVAGYVNGERLSSYPREKFQPPDFSNIFLNGLGVGTWSAVTKYKDLSVLDHSKGSSS